MPKSHFQYDVHGIDCQDNNNAAAAADDVVDDDDDDCGDDDTDHAALPVDGEQARAAFQLDCALQPKTYCAFLFLPSHPHSMPVRVLLLLLRYAQWAPPCVTWLERP